MIIFEDGDDNRVSEAIVFLVRQLEAAGETLLTDDNRQIELPTEINFDMEIAWNGVNDFIITSSASSTNPQVIDTIVTETTGSDTGTTTTVQGGGNLSTTTYGRVPESSIK
jgi:hypothetical protein